MADRLDFRRLPGPVLWVRAHFPEQRLVIEPRWRSVLQSEAAVNFNLREQRTKKVLSDSPVLVDFAIEIVNSVLNLPDEQVKFFEEFKLQKNCLINPAYQKVFGARWNEFWASKC